MGLVQLRIGLHLASRRMEYIRRIAEKSYAQYQVTTG